MSWLDDFVEMVDHASGASKVKSLWDNPVGRTVLPFQDLPGAGRAVQNVGNTSVGRQVFPVNDFLNNLVRMQGSTLGRQVLPLQDVRDKFQRGTGAVASGSSQGSSSGSTNTRDIASDREQIARSEFLQQLNAGQGSTDFAGERRQVRSPQQQLRPGMEGWEPWMEFVANPFDSPTVRNQINQTQRRNEIQRDVRSNWQSNPLLSSSQQEMAIRRAIAEAIQNPAFQTRQQQQDRVFDQAQRDQSSLARGERLPSAQQPPTTMLNQPPTDTGTVDTSTPIEWDPQMSAQALSNPVTGMDYYLRTKGIGTTNYNGKFYMDRANDLANAYRLIMGSEGAAGGDPENYLQFVDLFISSRGSNEEMAPVRQHMLQQADRALLDPNSELYQSLQTNLQQMAETNQYAPTGEGTIARSPEELIWQVVVKPTLEIVGYSGDNVVQTYQNQLNQLGADYQRRAFEGYNGTFLEYLNQQNYRVMPDISR